jgi:hypothetical protein
MENVFITEPDVYSNQNQNFFDLNDKDVYNLVINKCKDHSNTENFQDNLLYCIECKMCLCTLCNLNGHQSHVLLTKKEFNFQKETVDRIFYDVEQEINLNQIISNSEEIKENLKSLVNSNIDELHKRLEEVRQIKVREIDAMFGYRKKINIEMIIKHVENVKFSLIFFNEKNNKFFHQNSPNGLNFDAENTKFLIIFDLINLIFQKSKEIKDILDKSSDEFSIHRLNLENSFETLKKLLSEFTDKFSSKKQNKNFSEENLSDIGEVHKSLINENYSNTNFSENYYVKNKLESINSEFYNDVLQRISKYDEHIEVFKSLAHKKTESHESSQITIDSLDYKIEKGVNFQIGSGSKHMKNYKIKHTLSNLQKNPKPQIKHSNSQTPGTKNTIFRYVNQQLDKKENDNKSNGQKRMNLSNKYATNAIKEFKNEDDLDINKKKKLKYHMRRSSAGSQNSNFSMRRSSAASQNSNFSSQEGSPRILTTNYDFHETEISPFEDNNFEMKFKTEMTHENKIFERKLSDSTLEVINRIINPKHNSILFTNNLLLAKPSKSQHNQDEEDLDGDVCKPIIGTNEIQIYDRKKRILIKKKVNLEKNVHGYSLFLDGTRYVLINEKLYITGGRDRSQDYNVVLCYDIKNYSMSRLLDMRSSHSYHTLEYNDLYKTILVIGGQNNPYCELFDIMSNHWCLLPELNMPRANVTIYYCSFNNKIFSLFGLNGDITEDSHSDVIEVLNLKNLQGGWKKLEYNNKSDMDFKLGYCGVFPLTKDKLLIYGSNLYKYTWKSFSVFDLIKEEVVRVDKKLMEVLIIKARRSSRLSRILSLLK